MRLVGQFAPHESKAFHVFNRGKRGIVLNLADAAGRAVAHRLVRDFDVFLINARPGVPARLGLDYETLRAERPDLIYLDNTAYGPEGPSAHRAGADIIAQAYSGLMAGDEKFDEHDGPQLITATTPADFSAAYSSAIGVCAALYHRERTGEGQRIQTSLLASALTLENAFVSRLPVSDAVLLDPTLEAIEAARARGASWRELQTARGGLRSLVGGAFLLYYGGYQTSDGAVMLGCVTPANQQQVRDAIELGHDPTTDADFNPLDPAAVEVVASVRGRIAERFLSNTTDHWIERLDATGAPASQVNLPEDMVDDPQVEALGIMVELEHSLTGPRRWSARPGRCRPRRSRRRGRRRRWTKTQTTFWPNMATARSRSPRCGSVGRLVCHRGARADRIELSERGLRGVGAASLRHSSAPSVTPALSVTPACPSFLRRQESMRSVGSRAHPMFDGARSRAARWGLWWAVGRMEARRTVGRSHGFLPPQE